jgi:predicted DsbA family dithiol-disulfide isomerase
MTIDFVSDVACPWCAVGLPAPELALARIGDPLSVQLQLQPFELNPRHLIQGGHPPEVFERALCELVDRRD